jgi:hypothetical protein
MFAVYTCFFGNDVNWANVILCPPDEIDSYYFTNNRNTYNQLLSTKWKPIFIDIPISDDNVVCSEQSKHIRCCPWEYDVLEPYDYLCWIDSKLKFTNKARLHEIVSELSNSSFVWAFTQHPSPYRDVWGEYTAAIQHEKYARQADQYKKYIENRIGEGYDLKIPQRVCCGFSIRKKCPLAKEIGDFWFSEIQECGIEDQISFQFVHQKYNDVIRVFPYQYCWSYI